VALPGEQPPEVMRPAARLHRHGARRQLGGEVENGLPAHRPPEDHHASVVEPDDTAQVLAEIDTEDHDRHGSAPSLSAPAS
jgi:hypothetical protein